MARKNEKTSGAKAGSSSVQDVSVREGHHADSHA